MPRLRSSCLTASSFSGFPSGTRCPQPRHPVILRKVGATTISHRNHRKKRNSGTMAFRKHGASQYTPSTLLWGGLQLIRLEGGPAHTKPHAMPEYPATRTCLDRLNQLPQAPYGVGRSVPALTRSRVMPGCLCPDCWKNCSIREHQRHKAFEAQVDSTSASTAL